MKNFWVNLNNFIIWYNIIKPSILTRINVGGLFSCSFCIALGIIVHFPGAVNFSLITLFIFFIFTVMWVYFLIFGICFLIAFFIMFFQRSYDSSAQHFNTLPYAPPRNRLIRYMNRKYAASNKVTWDDFSFWAFVVYVVCYILLLIISV